MNTNRLKSQAGPETQPPGGYCPQAIQAGGINFQTEDACAQQVAFNLPGIDSRTTALAALHAKLHEDPVEPPRDPQIISFEKFCAAGSEKVVAANFSDDVVTEFNQKSEAKLKANPNLADTYVNFLWANLNASETSTTARDIAITKIAVNSK